MSEHDVDDVPEPPEEEAGDARKSRLRRLTRRLLDRKELAEDTKELLGAVIDGSDRAKTEVVRLVAREVRNYLDELKIKEDLKELVTSHSLEVRLSLHLKPLVQAAEGPAEPPADDDPEQ